MSQRDPLLSVLIAVRDDAAGLRATLDALSRQDAPPGWFEVVVIDDGSTDETVRVARSRDYVRVVSLETSGGAYVARNHGLAVARGRYVAITDAACAPAPDWVSCGVARLEADPEVIIAGRITMPLGMRPTLAAMVDVMAHLDQERYVNEWGFAATGNLMASAKTFKQAGPFDERLRSSGDAEWTRRAVRAGHKLVYAPEVSVAHPPRTTIPSLLRKARRIAEGAAIAHRLGVSSRTPSYRDPVSLLPWQRDRARQRLRENGADPGAGKALVLTLAQVALVNLAQAMFWLIADIRARRPGLGVTPNRPAAGGRRIVITNCVAQNGGDAAILEAVIRIVRTVLGDSTHITVIDDHPAAVAELFPNLQVESRLDAALIGSRDAGRFRSHIIRLDRGRLLAAAWLIARGAGPTVRPWLGKAAYDGLRERSRADAIISTGGTYLVERYRIGGRLLELEAALLLRCPLILFTQSLGPFMDEGNRRRLRRVIPRARLVLLRDERSAHYLRDLGGVRGENFRVLADGVFALPLRDFRDGPVQRVAVSVRDWPYASGEEANRDYRAGIGRLTEHLVLHLRLEVTFLSTCQGAPAYPIDDSAVAQDIVDGLPDAVRSGVTVDHTFRTPTELVDRLAEFDLVVATRMHAAILALVSGVPVFPISYEFKTQELFTRLGLASRVCSFDEVSRPALSGDVERFIQELPEIRPQLALAVAAEHESALSSLSAMSAALAKLV